MDLALAEIGHNNPPEPTPFDAVKTHIDDLMTEARNWCDGAAVGSQAEADEVSRLLEKFRLADAAADQARRRENEPYDAGKAAVQAKYAPLIADTKAVRGAVPTAISALKAALQPWLKRLDDEKRAKAEEARRVAEAAAAEAAKAVREAQASDLAAREAAEAKVTEARQAEAAATRAEADKAHAKGGARATGLRSYFEPVLTDGREALKHYMVAEPDALLAFLVTLAKADVAAGKRQIPGFDVIEDRRVV